MTNGQTKTPETDLRDVDAIPAAGVPDLSDIETQKAELRTEVNLKSIKEELQSVLHDPEARMAIVGAIGIGVLGYLFSPEEKEKFEEETEEEIDRMEEAGELEEVKKEAEKAVEEEVKKEGRKITEEEKKELVKEKVKITVQMQAVNIHGINSKNRKILAGYKQIKNREGKKIWVIDESIKPEDRVILPDEIFEIGSYSVLKQKDLTTFDAFKERICDIFQPQLKDNPAQQVKNATKALSYCAIGIYQILPIHHFNKMGWTKQGEKGLEKIYEFILSQEGQEDLNLKILAVSIKKYGGDIEVAAADYYSGAGRAVLNYKRDLAAGKDVSKYDWLKRKQDSTKGMKKKGKKKRTYGSILYYAETAGKYFKKISGRNSIIIDPDDREALLAFQKAIAKKETGFSAVKKSKTGTAKYEIA